MPNELVTIMISKDGTLIDVEDVAIVRVSRDDVDFLLDEVGDSDRYPEAIERARRYV